jgi:hypothetical protein
MADLSATESPAQEKARLRRERRAAKIAAGGADRLQAISSLQGGSHRDLEKDLPGTQAFVLVLHSVARSCLGLARSCHDRLKDHGSKLTNSSQAHRESLTPGTTHSVKNRDARP